MEPKNENQTEELIPNIQKNEQGIEEEKFKEEVNVK